MQMMLRSIHSMCQSLRCIVAELLRYSLHGFAVHSNAGQTIIIAQHREAQLQLRVES
jgi:hypothetical protein